MPSNDVLTNLMMNLDQKWDLAIYHKHNYIVYYNSNNYDSNNYYNYYSNDHYFYVFVLNYLL